jgi:hypothetical protein
MRASCCAIVALADSMTASCARRSCSFSMRLPHPGHGRAEHHEHAEPDRHRPEREAGVMRDHLVDHDLGEKRRGEPRDLQRQRRGEHVAPDPPVPQQLGHEPAKAEALRFRARGVRIGGGWRIARHQQDERLEGFEHAGERHGPRLRRGGVEQHHVVALAPGENRDVQLPRGRIGSFTARETDAGERRHRPQRGRGRLAGTETQRLQRRNQLIDRIRRRELLEQQVGVEGNAMQRAHRPERPREFLARNGTWHSIP